MTTTPPPTPGSASQSPALRVTLLTIGSVLVVGMLVLGGMQVARAATAQGGDDSGVYTVDADVSEVRVESSAASVRVSYDDVDRPVLDFDSGGSPVRLSQRVSGDSLTVTVGDDGWWSFGFLPWDSLGDASLEVTLPLSAAPVDLEVDSSAGRVDVAGVFGALDLSSSAGSIMLTGSSESLALDSSAGRIVGTDLDVDGDVTSSSSAGSTTLSFVSLPSSMEVESSAGSVRIALPDGEYEIRTDTSFGSVQQGVTSTPGAERLYTFESSAGSVTIEPAR